MNWKVSDDVKNVLKFNNLSGYFKRSPDDLKMYWDNFGKFLDGTKCLDYVK